MSYIWTKSGRRFYFDDLSKNKGKVKISDIAWGLSNTCRFSGQCRRFYSIAEHSLWVEKNVSDKNKLAALLHDATEAFMVDVAKPLKLMLPDYKKKELEVEAFLAEEFKFETPLSEEIHQIDFNMLKCEFNQLFNIRNEFDNPYPDLKLHLWKPHRAYREFMARYNELKS